MDDVPTTSRVVPVLHLVAAVGLAMWFTLVVLWPWIAAGRADDSLVAGLEKLCQRYRICHRMPLRSLSWGGGQLLVCSRCTGVAAGYLLGAVAALCGAERLRLWRIPCALGMIGLMGFSWLLGWLGQLDYLEAWSRSLWHAERVVAGALGGLGGYILIARCVVLLMQWLERRKHRKLEKAT